MIDLTYYGYGVGMCLAFWFFGGLLGVIFRVFQDNRFFR